MLISMMMQMKGEVFSWPLFIEEPDTFPQDDDGNKWAENIIKLWKPKTDSNTRNNHHERRPEILRNMQYVRFMVCPQALG